MTASIYFEVDDEKKKKFNIALAITGQRKKDVLNSLIDDFIEQVRKKNKVKELEVSVNG